MTTEADLLRLQARMQIRLDRRVDRADREIVRAWVRAWRELSREWAEAVDDLLTHEAPITPAMINRSTKAKKALQHTLKRMRELNKLAGVTVLGNLDELAAEASRWERRMIGAQIPAVGTAVAFDSISTRAVDAMVKRATQSIHQRLWPLSPTAEESLKSELTRGVAKGSHPNVVARRMVKRVEGAFNGGAARARNLARTELLDAHRYAAQETRKANRRVLKGWMWVAELSRRTCPACLSKHGQVFTTGSFGPLGHPSCRCTSVPVTKTYAELGIDVPEPPKPAFEDGEQWFRRQPRDTQLAIMGRKRLAAYEAGRLPWSQLAILKKTPGWRSSYVVRPVK